MVSKESFFGYSVNLIRLSEEDGEGWLADVPELFGCLADGETPKEALDNLKDVLESWLEVALEEGKEIPQPRIYVDSQYSGKFTLRIPKTLHRQLAQEADREGVSLNQFILSLLSYNFGAKTPETRLSADHNAYSCKGYRITYEIWDEKNRQDDIQYPMRYAPVQLLDKKTS